MDLIRQFAPSLPVLVAGIILLIAAIGKAGREKGASLFVLGAVGMCVMPIVTPLVYSLIMPRLIDHFGHDDIQNVHMVIGIIFNILWAVPVLLIAIATLQRPPAASQHKPHSDYPPPL